MSVDTLQDIGGTPFKGTQSDWRHGLLYVDGWRNSGEKAMEPGTSFAFQESCSSCSADRGLVLPEKRSEGLLETSPAVLSFQLHTNSEEQSFVEATESRRKLKSQQIKLWWPEIKNNYRGFPQKIQSPVKDLSSNNIYCDPDQLCFLRPKEEILTEQKWTTQTLVASVLLVKMSNFKWCNVRNFQRRG